MCGVAQQTCWGLCCFESPVAQKPKRQSRSHHLGVLFGCFGQRTDVLVYQVVYSSRKTHRFPPRGHLCSTPSRKNPAPWPVRDGRWKKRRTAAQWEAQSADPGRGGPDGETPTTAPRWFDRVLARVSWKARVLLLFLFCLCFCGGFSGAGGENPTLHLGGFSG